MQRRWIVLRSALRLPSINAGRAVGRVRAARWQRRAGGAATLGRRRRELAAAGARQRGRRAGGRGRREPTEARVRPRRRDLRHVDFADLGAVHGRHSLRALARRRQDVVCADRRASRPAAHHASIRVADRRSEGSPVGCVGRQARSEGGGGSRARLPGRGDLLRALRRSRRDLERRHEARRQQLRVLQDRARRRSARTRGGDVAARVRAERARSRVRVPRHADSRRSSARRSIAGASMRVRITDPRSRSGPMARDTRSGSIRSTARVARSTDN